MFNNFYVQKTSPVHQLNFWTKFLGFSLIFPLLAFLAPIKVLPILAGVFIILLILSRIGYSKFWNQTRIYIISLTVGIVVLTLLFSPGLITNRLLQGIILALRFALLVSFGVFFAAVTNPIEIPTGFLQTKIPHKYGVTLMVGYRLMPLLSQKIQTIINAQRARGARIDLSLENIPKLPLIIFALAIPVLRSTLETSVRLSDALISRGYNPEGKITPIPMKLSGYDLLFVLVTLSSFVLALKL